MKPILQVKDLEVTFKNYGGTIHAVNGISFNLYEDETLVLVGESGCGKSVTAHSILKLLPGKKTRIHEKSQIIFEDKNILEYSEEEMQHIRGNEISMIFQDPLSYLNPTMPIGKQVMESILIHQKVSKKEALVRTIKILELAQIPDPEKRLKQYPHEFSGGMRQRVLISIALASNPKILIADEPTTALDVTIQAEILELIQKIQKETKTAVMLITHDLGIAAEVADRIQVMYAGKIIERGRAEHIFKNAQHPYTKALLAAVPSVDQLKENKLYAPEGNHPDMLSLSKGCAFADRCEKCMKVCLTHRPPEMRVSEDHLTSCWLQHDFAKGKNNG
ncbi:ABC transporter ATP-binding protein [Treponema sp. OMZ 787]|uniref:ABC transporter ATP-binding protein n=1 Tax=Treponema sp. OMZ 787 TaxID=2563669 RepID=UPI0020A462F6|nr:ABC transporter ATP-binding protein [Treponema sp. OMZ 787]UTC62876.1 ABC transporter ATP-binding protein [Treponema sp. OMZ 787]